MANDGKSWQMITEGKWWSIVTGRGKYWLHTKKRIKQQPAPTNQQQQPPVIFSNKSATSKTSAAFVPQQDAAGHDESLQPSVKWVRDLPQQGVVGPDMVVPPAVETSSPRITVDWAPGMSDLCHGNKTSPTIMVD